MDSFTKQFSSIKNLRSQFDGCISSASDFGCFIDFPMDKNNLFTKYTGLTQDCLIHFVENNLGFRGDRNFKFCVSYDPEHEVCKKKFTFYYICHAVLDNNKTRGFPLYLCKTCGLLTSHHIQHSTVCYDNLQEGTVSEINDSLFLQELWQKYVRDVFDGYIPFSHRYFLAMYFDDIALTRIQYVSYLPNDIRGRYLDDIITASKVVKPVIFPEWFKEVSHECIQFQMEDCREDKLDEVVYQDVLAGDLVFGDPLEPKSAIEEPIVETYVAVMERVLPTPFTTIQKSMKHATIVPRSNIAVWQAKEDNERLTFCNVVVSQAFLKHKNTSKLLYSDGLTLYNRFQILNDMAYVLETSDSEPVLDMSEQSLFNLMYPPSRKLYKRKSF